MRVRIALDQLDPRILPDMGIKVSFLEDGAAAGAEGGAAGARPRPCVTGATQAFVWVVRDGKVEKRAVQTGAARGRPGAGDGRARRRRGRSSSTAARLRDGAAVELKAAS